MQYLIYARENCVLRHHVCPDGLGSHTGGTGGDEVFRKCAEHLVLFEGQDNIRTYLEKMTTVFPQVGKEAFQRFNSIYPKDPL
jgi:hypothetical protein